MFTARPTAVPDAAVDPVWTTRRPERTVLGVVHNVTSATRLFDVLPLLATDHRVEVIFACTGSSPFGMDVDPHLDRNRVRQVGWSELAERRLDLTISTSHGGPVHELNSPVVILPHGMGYNKYLNADTRKSRNPVFGLAPEWLLSEGVPIASSLVFSHDEQVERLRRSCPAALDVAVVAGDPCFDRMLASVPLRRTYRDAFGLQPGQQLVFVSSTWGPESLYGTAPKLVRELRDELPLDEFAVAVALHPNIWAHHSPWQVEMWLDDCRRRGVVLVPPEEGWRAGLIASDLVVGDHGSVTFYGAALGKPTLLATWPEHAVDPASPVGMFIAAADRLTPRRPLGEQARAAIERGRTHEEITRFTTSAPGAAARLLRAEFYRLLHLPEPEAPALTRVVPLPELSPRPPAVEIVRADLRIAEDQLSAALVRYTADVAPLPAGAGLMVSTDEPCSAQLELADIVVHDQPGDAHGWIADTLDAFPGAVLATMPVNGTTWVVGTRDAGFVEFTSAGGDGRVWAVVVLAWLREGRRVADFPALVRLQAGQASSASLCRVASAEWSSPRSS
ncbi:hypothetical protein [Lentzea albidocapillata]|uniref:hypothetical protein n=1 Tax=Lentzea albidocapillata TaxID=40571 RepID=UPI000B7DD1C2|nr:hypothetical protein [Lentzea albidocapillata]